MGSEEKTYTFRCTVCGWEYESDSPELPEDFVCEVYEQSNTCHDLAQSESRAPETLEARGFRCGANISLRYGQPKSAKTDRFGQILSLFADLDGHGTPGTAPLDTG